MREGQEEAIRAGKRPHAFGHRRKVVEDPAIRASLIVQGLSRFRQNPKAIARDRMKTVRRIRPVEREDVRTDRSTRDRQKMECIGREGTMTRKLSVEPARTIKISRARSRFR